MSIQYKIALQRLSKKNPILTFKFFFSSQNSNVFLIIFLRCMYHGAAWNVFSDEKSDLFPLNTINRSRQSVLWIVVVRWYFLCLIVYICRFCAAYTDYHGYSRKTGNATVEGNRHDKTCLAGYKTLGRKVLWSGFGKHLFNCLKCVLYQF